MDEMVTRVYARQDGKLVKLEAINVDCYSDAIRMAQELLGVQCAMAVVRKEGTPA